MYMQLIKMKERSKKKFLKTSILHLFIAFPFQAKLHFVCATRKSAVISLFSYINTTEKNSNQISGRFLYII